VDGTIQRTLTLLVIEYVPFLHLFFLEYAGELRIIALIGSLEN
jgi:hypothetical protein